MNKKSRSGTGAFTYLMNSELQMLWKLWVWRFGKEVYTKTKFILINILLRGFKQDCPDGQLSKEKILEMYTMILPAGNAKVIVVFFTFSDFMLNFNRGLRGHFQHIFHFFFWSSFSYCFSKILSWDPDNFTGKWLYIVTIHMFTLYAKLTVVKKMDGRSSRRRWRKSTFWELDDGENRSIAGVRWTDIPHLWQRWKRKHWLQGGVFTNTENKLKKQREKIENDKFR